MKKRMVALSVTSGTVRIFVKKRRSRWLMGHRFLGMEEVVWYSMSISHTHGQDAACV